MTAFAEPAKSRCDGGQSVASSAYRLKNIDESEKERLRAIRDRHCVPRKCDCIRECYRVWNRWWAEKAAVCTHPCWAKVKDPPRPAASA